MNLPQFNGWNLLGAYPDGEPDDVGSWLLTHGDEAALLEIPPGLEVKDILGVLRQTGTRLRYVVASHDHEDHLDADVWSRVKRHFRGTEFIHPADVRGDRLIHLCGEPLWLIRSPKHSLTDVVTVFRGVAMTGDIELGMLASVNREVPVRIKRQSMEWLRGFQERTGYRVHSIVSAHLNDVRTGIHWPELFAA